MALVACVSLLSQLCVGFGAEDRLDWCIQPLLLICFSGVIVFLCDDRCSLPSVFTGAAQVQSTSKQCLQGRHRHILGLMKLHFMREDVLVSAFHCVMFFL